MLLLGVDEEKKRMILSNPNSYSSHKHTKHMAVTAWGGKPWQPCKLERSATQFTLV